MSVLMIAENEVHMYMFLYMYICVSVYIENPGLKRLTFLVNVTIARVFKLCFDGWDMETQVSSLHVSSENNDFGFASYKLPRCLSQRAISQDLCFLRRTL